MKNLTENARTWKNCTGKLIIHLVSGITLNNSSLLVTASTSDVQGALLVHDSMEAYSSTTLQGLENQGQYREVEALQ